MNRKKVKSAMLVSALVVVSVLVLKSYMVYCSNGRTSDLMLEENVEALTSGESGAACPNGCKDIGWGLNKILEFDCNYDHFSCCDSWGC